MLTTTKNFANRTQNCHARYNILYSDDPADEEGQYPIEYFIYNTVNGVDFMLTEQGEGLSCQFERLTGNACYEALNFLAVRIPSTIVTNISVDYSLCKEAT